MADSNTCKLKTTKTKQKNWTQEQLLLLAQLVNENKDIIKVKFGVGITSKTKGDTFLKGQLSSNVSKMFTFRSRLPATAILGVVCGLVLVT